MIYRTRFDMFGEIVGEIHLRRCADGSIQQRHIYHRTTLGEHNPPWEQEWINAGTRNWERAIQHYSPAPEITDEWQLAIIALESISNGHNDPRTLAAETLAAIRRQTP